MSKAESFTFEGCEVEANRTVVSFSYSINYESGPATHFTEKIEFPVALPKTTVVKKLLEALHIGLGISYYKALVPPEFKLPYKLTKTEADFWNDVYQNGLAEFLYVNKLAVDRLAKFSATGSAEANPGTVGTEEKAVLGIGGGKDSIVAGELLKELHIPVTGYVLGTGEHHGQAKSVADVMKIELLGVKRTLDPELLELNKQPGTYNGHVPISLIFALVGLLLCAATKNRYLIVANEAAASLPNTEWQGRAVNHQWSKSFEFEKMLQDLVHTSIATDLDYFSAIRPLSSVAVMKIFSQFPAYFNVFTSCNRVFLIDPARRPNNRWCGVCPKDLSTFILLAPWIDEDQLVEIFGKNLFQDVRLEKLFRELTGLEGHRPLDCVGTEEEAILSLNLAAQQRKLADTELMKHAQQNGLLQDKDWQAELSKALTPADEHAVPTTLASQLLQKMQERLAK